MRRVLLVDDHAVFRQSLALLTAARLDREAVQAATPDGARRALADPDGGVCLAIVDLDLPGGGAFGLIEELRETGKAAAVLAFTDVPSPRVRARAFRAGADEVLASREPVRRYLDAAARLGRASGRRVPGNRTGPRASAPRGKGRGGRRRGARGR
jgi:DNA-binding NarL/FixJ family response regulator